MTDSAQAAEKVRITIAEYHRSAYEQLRNLSRMSVADLKLLCGYDSYEHVLKTVVADTEKKVNKLTTDHCRKYPD